MIIGFDLDGTLIDSMDLHKDAFVYTASKMNFKFTEEDFRKAQGYPIAVMIRSTKKDMTDLQLEEFIRIKEEYVKQNISRIRPFPDTVKTLAELGKKAKIIIISNTPFKDILHFLEAADINPLFFETIIGSDLVKHPKPWPDEIFLAEKFTQHKLNYYVGDSAVDVKTGNIAKVKTFAVATGYSTKEELKKEKPYKILDHLSDLLLFVK
jgi:phosphoglycolate phosphatase-like HAD superfamily hydrolase